MCYLRESRAFPSSRARSVGSSPAFLILTKFPPVPTTTPLEVLPSFPLHPISWQQASSSAYLFCQFSFASSPNKHTPFPDLCLQLQGVTFAKVKPILAMSVRAETPTQEMCGGDFLGAVAEDKATSSGTGKVKEGMQCQERHDQSNDAFPRGRADQVSLGESG